MSIHNENFMKEVIVKSKPRSEEFTFMLCLNKDSKKIRIASAIKSLPTKLKITSKGRTANFVYVTGLYYSTACW